MDKGHISIHINHIVILNDIKDDYVSNNSGSYRNVLTRFLVYKLYTLNV